MPHMNLVMAPTLLQNFLLLSGRVLEREIRRSGTQVFFCPTRMTNNKTSSFNSSLNSVMKPRQTTAIAMVLLACRLN